MEMEGSIRSPSPPSTRIAVVTGANRGIGLEVCRQLAGNGLTVVLTARDETRGLAAVEKLKEAGFSDVVFHQLEITDAKSIARLADFLKTRFGKLDILVNNAAVGAVEYVQDPIDSSPSSDQKFSGMDELQRLQWMFQNVRETCDSAKEGVQTNYYGTKHVIQALLPLLKTSSDGRIVNVSSGFGLLRGCCCHRKEQFQGIGLEVCRQLASKGVMVILTARDEKKGSEVDMLHGSGLPDVQFHRLDVSDPTDAARLAEFIQEKFGRLDILINNAGVTGVTTTAEIGTTTTIQELLAGKSTTERLQWLVQHSMESYEEARECLKINYFGTKFVTEALLPLLSFSNGRLINVSSTYGLLRYFSGEDLKQELNDIDNLTVERLDEMEMSGLFLKDYKNDQLKSHGWPADSGCLAYKVSKALINGYTRMLAKAHLELRIISVHPGFCKTDVNFHTGEFTAEDGASCIVAVALFPEGGPTGMFFSRTEEAPFV